MKTYTYPDHVDLKNGIRLPSYLGLGVLDFDSITYIDNDGASGEYCLQSDGRLTNDLVYRIITRSELSTVHRYFNGKEYKVTSDPELQSAFFKSFVLKKHNDSYLLNDDEPMFNFAKEITELGAFSFLYNVRYLYYPAGFIVNIKKPILNEEQASAWRRFSKIYNRPPLNNCNTILNDDLSPFLSVEPDGTGTVFPVFLKDAIGLLKNEELLGNSQESAVKVFY